MGSTRFICLVILLALVPPASAENWQQLYNQALRDLESARWQDAIARLQEAVKQQPVSGQLLTGEKGENLRYFPYYLLGKANFHLGRYAEAADFFTREAGQPNVPTKLAQDIDGYQQQIRAALAAEKQAEFNRALEKAEAARLKQDYTEAAAQLERARQLNNAEFKARGLDWLLANIRKSEKKLADESRFRLLLDQAEEKEQQGALQTASSILDDADRLIPGRADVAQIRARIQQREQSYTRLKEAAANDEKEGRLASAVDKLRQAAQADAERFTADGLPGRLADLAASVSREAEIQQLLLRGGQAFKAGNYPEAIAEYEKVIQKDPNNRLAVLQKRRSESLQLINQAQKLIKTGASNDALAAFNRSYYLDRYNGELIYEKMRPHVPTRSERQGEVRLQWLELMRQANPERFKRENASLSAGSQSDRQRQPQRQAAPKPNPDEGKEKAQQDAVFAAMQRSPEEAVRLLERLRATRGKSDADLESWTGVAYARLSLLTLDPEQKKRLRAKASEHFRVALRLDPQRELNPRLVPPQIQQIFSEVQKGE